jgi:hypothetical protein
VVLAPPALVILVTGAAIVAVLLLHALWGSGSSIHWAGIALRMFLATLVLYPVLGWWILKQTNKKQ